jgi:hypothetical protein
MAVISITITTSEEQVVAGIPRSISLSTNITSTIFYTLNGEDPTLLSDIYITPILIPNSTQSITLKVLATNGSDYSPIITETYLTNMLNNVRLSHSTTNQPVGSQAESLYPFGTDESQPVGTFVNPAGITVDNPALATYPNAFDADGYPAAFSNAPYTTENYSIVYSTKNAQGEQGPGIGTLPGKVSVEVPPSPPEESEQFSKMFDPRALVIFQDFSTEDPNDPPYINRQFFTLDNPERSRDGNSFYTTAIDAPAATGSFLRSHYNPRDNTITYYYMDTSTNRWIISKAPYQPTGTWDGNMAGIVSGGKSNGSRFVFEWIPFQRRVIF